MARRPNEFLSTEVVLPHDHASLSATLTFELGVARRPMRVVSASYGNATGLAQSGSNYFVITLKKGAATLLTVADSSTTAIAAGGFTTAVPATPIRLEAGDVLSVAYTRTGTATLPVGRLLVELAYA